MNILFLNTYPAWGGGETWMLDVADGLRARGHHCIIAGRPGRAWFERTRQLGWNPIALDIRGEFAPLICARIHRLVRRAGIDVVVCNFYKEVRLAGLARLGAARPAIVNMKGLPLINDSLRHRLTYRYFIDNTVVCAEFIREEYRRHPWANLDRVFVINNCYKPPAASPSRPSFREELKIPERHLVVGAIARCEFRKGLQDLIAAAPEVVAAYPETTFVLVGDGPERVQLQEQAAHAGIGARVLFPGFRFDMDAVTEAFDLFVLPSHHEGFPYVTQIAMYHAKAIVATRVGAVPEAITSGVNGILVDPKSPAQLAAAVTMLLGDSRMRARLGTEAAATLRSRFSFDGMITRFEDLFRRLVEKSSGSLRRPR